MSLGGGCLVETADVYSVLNLHFLQFKLGLCSTWVLGIQDISGKQFLVIRYLGKLCMAIAFALPGIWNISLCRGSLYFGASDTLACNGDASRTQSRYLRDNTLL